MRKGENPVQTQLQICFQKLFRFNSTGVDEGERKSRTFWSISTLKFMVQKSDVLLQTLYETSGLKITFLVIMLQEKKLQDFLLFWWNKNNMCSFRVFF
jgi:hypothetical protein